MPPLYLVIFGILTLILRAGFALQLSGSLRAKNSAGIIVRLTAETAAAALAFWAFGFAILYQKHNAYIGIDTGLMFREAPESSAREFFYLTICLIGSSVVSGAIAERSKFYAGVLASAVIAGVVFPIVGHLVWFGKFHQLNFIDFGGASVIHLSSAVFAAIGVAVLGSRAGKFNRDGSSNSIPGHSLLMLSAGVLLLLAGWFPYLLGCGLAHHLTFSQWDDVTLATTATKILLAAAGGVAGGLIFSHRKYGKPDLFFTYSGLLGGLVAISGPLVAVSSTGAILIGLVAGILVPMFALKLDSQARLDDPVGLIAIHGIAGIWGMLATAIFFLDISLIDRLKLLAIQSGGIAIIMLLSALVASVLFLTLRQMNWLRVSEADERDGLDVAEHGVQSHPEFTVAPVPLPAGSR